MRRSFHHRRFGNIVDYGVEQRGDGVGRLIPHVGHPALLGRAVNGAVIELLLGRSEREHEVENLLVDHLRAAIRLIDLVDYHDRFLAQRKGFLQYETGLGHRPLESIDQQQHAVAHVEHAFHLAAEIGVARCVYDIDFMILVNYGNVFGKDRDSALALQIVVVQNEFARLGIFPQHIALKNHLIDQCGLTVIDVGNDRDIA